MRPSDNIIAHGRAEASSSVLLEVRSLGKTYGDQHALCDISFDARAREVIGLIGPNGAGKTTLLEALAGLLPADQGHVLWHGASLPIQRRREVMFYLPDGLRPWDDQYVVRVLGFFAKVYRRLTQHVIEIIRALELQSILRKRVGALSKGFAQRLMLALAPLTPQPLLLMDEPFDGFDLRQTRQMMGVLRQVAENGRTLILAIHQLADAERVADRMLLLGDGKLRGTGSLEDLRAKTSLPDGSLKEIFLALT